MERLFKNIMRKIKLKKEANIRNNKMWSNKDTNGE